MSSVERDGQRGRGGVEGDSAVVAGCTSRWSAPPTPYGRTYDVSAVDYPLYQCSEGTTPEQDSEYP